METPRNIGTGFGSKIHRSKRVAFVIHPLYGKIVSRPENPLVIPKCIGIRISRHLSLDHLYQTDEPVTCEKCS